MCTHVFRWVCRGASLEDGVCKVGKVYEVGPIVGQRFHDGPVSRKREAHEHKSAYLQPTKVARGFGVFNFFLVLKHTVSGFEGSCVKSREKKQFCTIGIGIGITLDVV